MGSKARGERGQATLELALGLPLVSVLIAIVVAAGLVTAHHARVWHAAREAARVAAVDNDPEAARNAVRRTGLVDYSLTLAPPPQARVAGEPVTAVITARPTLRVPLIGPLFNRIVLRARAVMSIEVP